MHELAVTQSILDLAVENAQKANAIRVTDINLVIGRLSSIVDDSIQFYWDIIAKDTICENAVLHFQRIDAELECIECGTHYKIQAELTPCPKCKSKKVNILSGKEFRLDSIEVTNEDEA